MEFQPLTQEEIQKANAYIASLGPEKVTEKINLIQSFKAGPYIFNPIIRSLINPQ